MKSVLVLHALIGLLMADNSTTTTHANSIRPHRSPNMTAGQGGYQYGYSQGQQQQQPQQPIVHQGQTAPLQGAVPVQGQSYNTPGGGFEPIVVHG